MKLLSRFTTWCLCLGLLLGAAAPGAAAAPAPDPGPPAAGPAPALRLAVLADTHWEGGKANANTRKALAALAALKPHLVVHAGDVTELGAPREYDEYLAAAGAALPGVPAHYVPGNHDARWLDAGKATFRARMGRGETYRSFTQGGVHVVLLDSSIEAATHGHFDPVQLDWLRADLAALPAGTPVLVFFHHPLGYTPVSWMDTEEDLLKLLAPYNVRGVFTGHGHLHMRWERNGIPFYMVQGGFEGGFKVVDIDGGRIKVYDGAAGQPLKLATDLPLAAPAARGQLAFRSLEPLAAGKWRIAATGSDLPATAKVWYRIGTGAWQPMSPALGGVYYATAEAQDLPPGRHRVELWAAPVGAQYPGKLLTKEQWDTRDAGPAWTGVHDFEVPGAGQPAPAWQYRAAAGIQAAPAVGPQLVYAGARDGSLAALDAATGAVRWVYRLPGPILGSPALSTDRVAVADTLGNVAALDAASGRVLWTHRQGAPVLAEPLWAAGLLIYGDGQGTVTALDRITGRVHWQTKPAATAVRARATYAAGTVYVGAWDRRVYALDAFTGQIRWQKELPGDIYYAPANQPPLYFRGRLFVTRSQPSGDAGLYALDARDGAVLWKAAGGFGYSAPVLHGGLVVAATGGGAVSGFDPMTGAKRWTAWTGLEAFDGALSSYGGDVVLGGLHGLVAAVRPAGTRAATVWRHSFSHAYVYARPAPGDGLLYLGAMDGTLTALKVAAPPAPALTGGSPGQAVPLAVAADFPDTRDHQASGYIGLAQAMGLAAGYPDGGFRPEGTLTRAELAALQARWLGLTAPAATFATRFADTKGHWAAPYVAALEEKGLVQGERAPDGRLLYHPDRPVTRAEAVQITARLIARLQPSGAFASGLADVAGHWSAPAVRSVEEAGLLSGTVPAEAGFAPDRRITRAEAVSLLVKGALGR